MAESIRALRRQNLRPLATTKETPVSHDDDDDEGCLISGRAKLTSSNGFLRRLVYLSASQMMRDTCWSPMVSTDHQN